MSLAFKQLRVYVRSGLLVIAGVAVLLVLFKNRDHAVGIWFFGVTNETQPTNVVWLMLGTAAGTLVVRWVLAIAWGLLRDMRDVKQLRALNEATKALDDRAAELENREQRIDDKISTVIASDEEEAVEDGEADTVDR